MNEQTRQILEGRAEGRCEKYIWRWFVGGKSVTKEANRLLKKGLVEASYYKNGAAINPTEVGRALLKTVQFSNSD